MQPAVPSDVGWQAVVAWRVVFEAALEALWALSRAREALVVMVDMILFG